MTGNKHQHKDGNDVMNRMLELGSKLSLLGVKGEVVVRLQTYEDGSRIFKFIRHALSSTRYPTDPPPTPRIVLDGQLCEEITVYGVRLRWPARDQMHPGDRLLLDFLRDGGVTFDSRSFPRDRSKLGSVQTQTVCQSRQFKTGGNDGE